jgi:outer membrane protein OmpA-like peptidoglycan-associated protein
MFYPKHTSLICAIVVTLSCLVAGCGSGGLAGAPTTSTTSPTAGLASFSGSDASTFTNSVPETPWWWRTAPPQAKSSDPVKLSWTLSGDVLFDTGSATLSPSALSQLSGIVSQAGNRCDATITVVGYTDDVPDPSFPGDNQGLSEARAATVASVFRQAKRPGERIISRGEGASNPVGDNTTAIGREENRRTVITLVVLGRSCRSSSSGTR